MNESLFGANSGEVGELQGEVQAALGLLTSERADRIIGEEDDEYGALIKGVRSSMTMLWMLMKSFGAKESPNSLKGFAQAMTIVLTLVHYAYALGMRRGQGASDG